MVKEILVLIATLTIASSDPLGQTTVCDSQNIVPSYLPKPTSILESSILPLIAYLASLNIPISSPYANFGVPGTTVSESTPNLGNFGSLDNLGNSAGFPFFPYSNGLLSQLQLPVNSFSPNTAGRTLSESSNTPISMPASVCENPPNIMPLNLPLRSMNPSTPNTLPMSNFPMSNLPLMSMSLPMNPSTVYDSLPNLPMPSNFPTSNMPLPGFPMSNLPLMSMSLPMNPSTNVYDTSLNLPMPLNFPTSNMPLPGFPMSNLPLMSLPMNPSTTVYDSSSNLPMSLPLNFPTSNMPLTGLSMSNLPSCLMPNMPIPLPMQGLPWTIQIL